MVALKTGVKFRKKSSKNLQKKGKWLTNTASGAEDGDLLLDGGSGGEGAVDTGGEHSKKSPLKFLFFFVLFFQIFLSLTKNVKSSLRRLCSRLSEKAVINYPKIFFDFFGSYFFRKKSWKVKNVAI